jgi:trigger factor
VEVTINEVSEVARELEILANAQELQPHFEKAYVDYRPKIDLKGFRKGKVPLEMVKKLYGEMIEQEALQEIATEFYRRVVKEKELKPIGEPALIDLNYKRGELAKFRIRYDVRPQIELKGYKNIEVEKIVHTITGREIEREILRLRRANATFEPVRRAENEEHVVTCTVQDVDETNMPIIGRKSENVRFYLADETLDQPFRDALKNAEVGGEYSVKFLQQHGEHSHDVHSKLSVKKVERVVLPELNEAFVAKLTKEKIKSVEDFYQDMRKDVEAYWKSKTDRQVVNSITAEIIRRHEFQVPESLVRSVLEGLLEEVKNENPKKELPHDFNVEKFFGENRAYAIYQSKWALLREEIVKAEQLDVSDAELEALAAREAEKIKIDRERLLQYYKSSEQVKDRMLSDKLMRMLVDSAKIVEVPEPVQQQP